VEVRVEARYVYLQVGQRDWQWDRETGSLVGAGTNTCCPAGAGEGQAAGAIPVNLPFDLNNPPGGDGGDPLPAANYTDSPEEERCHTS
jgi:hypothetical protein